MIDNTNTIVYGLFDDVDIRSEARFDELSTDFTHITLDGEHTFSGGALRLHGSVGHSDAEHDNPVQTTLLFDRADVDGYSYDYRQDSRLPLITYGNVDVTNPATWTLSQVRLRPQSSNNTFDTAQFDVAWDVTDKITLKAGPQYKKFELETASLATVQRHADESGGGDPGKRRRDADRELQPDRADERPPRPARGQHHALAHSGPGPGRVAVRSVQPFRLACRHRDRARQQLRDRGAKTPAPTCRPTCAPISAR